MHIYQIGDEVYLIHSGQYGWITERYDEETWLVDLDGDEIPVHEEDLLPAAEAERGQGEAETDAGKLAADRDPTWLQNAGASGAPLPGLSRDKEQPQANSSGTPGGSAQGRGFYQLFIPLKNGHYSRWLINETTTDFQVEWLRDEPLLRSQIQKPEVHRKAFPPDQLPGSPLLSGQALELGLFTLDDLHHQSTLQLRLYWLDRAKSLQLSWARDLRIRKAAFAQRQRSYQADLGPGLLFLLFEVAPPPPLNYEPVSRVILGQDEPMGGRGKRPALVLDECIDLHADKLGLNIHAMHPAEILALQLSRARQYVERAMHTPHKKVYLIHGVGSGRLRAELHRMLQEHPFVQTYHHAYFPKYGFGATELTLDK